MNKNITDQFIENIYSIKMDQCTEGILLRAKKCLLDYFGVTLAGSKMLSEKDSKLLDFLASEEGKANVFGSNKKTTVQNAVLINGISSHYAELDDGHRLGMIHLGSPIISGLLSVAEQKQINGKQLLYGIIIGYEVAVRLSIAMQPSHKKKGYHTTSTCGTIGAAMAIATALEYSEKQMKATLSASVTSAAGILETQEDGSELKPYNAARAALNGYASALVGAAGFDSPDDILGGKRGLFAVMADEYDFSSLIKDDVASFWIESIYMKKYASCRHSHPAIEAAINTMKKNKLKVDELEKVNIYTYKSAVLGHDHKKIKGINSAKMSTPYSVAVAIETGKAGIYEYSSDKIHDKRILSLTNKINMYEDSELTKWEPKKRAAVVECILANGKTYRDKIEYPKGEPENPMTQEDIEEKFIDLAFYSGKTREEAKIIIEKIWCIEENLAELFKII
jgi:2-methylcitrate dehydratase PrpD